MYIRVYYIVYTCLCIGNFEHISKDLSKSLQSFSESIPFMVIEIVIIMKKYKKNWVLITKPQLTCIIVLRTYYNCKH